MVLENNICCVNIKIDDMYTVESTDNKFYDLTYNPKLYKHGDVYKTLSVDIDLFNKKYRIALIGDFYSCDMDCAVLEEDTLTVLQNDVIMQINVASGELTRYNQFKCFGNNDGIYRIKDGYIIHGEIEITKLDLEFNKMWSFSGTNAFVSEYRQKCFQICKNSIRLYDYEDNYYEIDFDGNLLQEIKTNEVNINSQKHTESQSVITGKNNKRFLTVCGIIILSTFVIIAVIIGVSTRNRNKNEDFYLKYEYYDGWGGKINQIIEINDFEYTYSLLIENHFSEEDTNETKSDYITEEIKNELNNLLQENRKNWKRKNKKIVNYLNGTHDLPSEHLVIVRNGVTVELDYLPLCIESVLEDAVDESIYPVIEQAYDKS